MESIINILKRSNQNLRNLMDQLESISERNDPRSDKLFTDFKEEFTKHDDIEEQLLYPALEKYPDLNMLVLKGEEAHHLIKVGMMELRIIPFASERWLPKFSVLHDAILNHLEEEEDKLFPQIHSLQDQAILEKLDKQTHEHLQHIPTPPQQIFV